MEHARKNIWNYLSGVAVTTFGSSVVQFAIIWYITLETKSGVMMTIVTIASTLPQLFVTPFAGVWADRYDKKKIIVISDLAIAFATLILAIVFLSGYEAKWLVFLIAAIRSLGAGIQSPAAGAFVPQFVPEESLLKVNGGISTIHSTSQLIAPAVSGLLLQFASISMIFFIDVLTAVIGCALIFRVIAPPLKQKTIKSSSSAWSEMKAGLKYAKEHPFLKEILIFYASFMIFIGPSAALTPLHAALKFGDDVWRLTSIEMCFSIGAVIGGLVLSATGGFKNRILSLALSCIGFGVFTVLLGVVPYFFIYTSLFIFMGFGLPYFNTPAVTMVQQGVDKEMLGRVMSLFVLISSSAFPMSMMIFGPMADYMKIEWLLIGTGLIITLLGVRVWFDKKLHEKTMIVEK
ncbi:MAG: major facilitator superfamily 1 [Bacillales bacterium]|jgi:DHA3 family macrolide efflux protein-like MFS transporter|nr:major facilitator superfamily 1 [Bacillales bacterium]